MTTEASTSQTVRRPVVFLAGATGGIGSEVARLFATRGATLHLGARNRAQGERVSVDFPTGSTTVAECDATDPDSVRNWVDEGLAAHGRVDALVSCVGTALLPSPFVQTDPADWGQILNAELTAVLILAHRVTPLLVAQGSGRIVILSSDSAFVGAPGQAVSSAARGGANAFCRALAREVAKHGVSVNTVCPGPVDGETLERLKETSPQLIDAIVRAIPNRRPTRAREVAELFAYLALGDSAAITGQAMSINGGSSMR